MKVGELIEMVTATRPQAPLSDLLNGPHKMCTCGGPCSGHMPADPGGKS